jgi:regulator of protease activity HflC (stomatin/prohibitin superfamily)
MEDKRIAAIRKNAEAEILKMLEAAEQKLHQIIEEARKTANQEASKTFKEMEQKVLRIIQETMKIAEADAARIVAQAEEKAQQIIEEAKKKAEIMEKAILEMEGEGEKRKAIHRRRVELVIIPPVDFVQLEKLRVSLNQLANLRILSMWGNSDGGASIFALTEKPDSLIPDLRKIDVVDEAMKIDEELLDSDLMNHFLKTNLPLRPSKHTDEQRILVLLKRTG